MVWIFVKFVTMEADPPTEFALLLDFDEMVVKSTDVVTGDEHSVQDTHNGPTQESLQISKQLSFSFFVSTTDIRI